MADEKTINEAIDYAWIDIRRSSNFDKEEAITKLIERRTAVRYQDYVRRVYGAAAVVDMMRFFEECDDGGERG